MVLILCTLEHAITKVKYNKSVIRLQSIQPGDGGDLKSYFS